MPTASIKISRPCAESWDAMTPAAAGRHCATCQKTVVDFTLKSDAEILAYFQQTGPGNTCGRFRPEQVARPLRPAPPAPRPARWPAWLSGLLVTAATAQGCQPTTHSEPHPLTLSPTAAVAPDSPELLDSAVVEMPDVLERVITGQVYDVASQRPVGRATVQLLSTTLAVTTDAEGRFAISLPEAQPTPHGITLRLTAAGYSPQVVVAAADHLPTHGLAIAHLSYPLPQMMLGEVAELPDK